MKRLIGNALMVGSLAAILAAIWLPAGEWWQWTASAVVMLLLGALLLGGQTPTEPPTPTTHPAPHNEDRWGK